jgi:hypothetical protein
MKQICRHGQISLDRQTRFLSVFLFSRDRWTSLDMSVTDRQDAAMTEGFTHVHTYMYRYVHTYDTGVDFSLCMRVDTHAIVCLFLFLGEKEDYTRHVTRLTRALVIIEINIREFDP